MAKARAGKGVIRAALGAGEGRVADRADPRAAAWRRLQTQATERAETRRFPVEGLRAVELLLAGEAFAPRELILAVDELENRQPDTRVRVVALIARARALALPVHDVSREVFRHIADVKKVRGVMAIAEDPAPSIDALADDVGRAKGLAIATVGLADPGNLGTLVRTGAAFGARALFALDGTTEPLHPKVLRASAGHLLPAVRADWDAFADRCAARGIALVGLDLASGDDAAGAQHTLGGGPIVGPDTPVAVCVGSEGHGFGAGVSARFDHRVRIPMADGADSLNAAVAGALLLWELRRTPG